jgi:hypothetical protein
MTMMITWSDIEVVQRRDGIGSPFACGLWSRVSQCGDERLHLGSGSAMKL